MDESKVGLIGSLGLGPREHLALVGGGGKTSLMFALAKEAREKNKRVVTTTTTKIQHREALRAPVVLFTESVPTWRENLREELPSKGHVFLGQSLLGSGKVNGIAPALANGIYGDYEVDYLLVEADGSAGHPVKAPAEHEPVIPAQVTTVVAVMGLEALGQPLSPEMVFRIDLFRRLTGMNLGQVLTPDRLSRLFQGPDGLFKGAPPSARRVALLNKRDLLAKDQDAKDLAYAILKRTENEIDRVVIGSIMEGARWTVVKGD